MVFDTTTETVAMFGHHIKDRSESANVAATLECAKWFTSYNRLRVHFRARMFERTCCAGLTDILVNRSAWELA